MSGQRRCRGPLLRWGHRKKRSILNQFPGITQLEGRLGPGTHLVALADAFVFLDDLGVSHVLIAVISTLDGKLPVLVERLQIGRASCRERV